MSDQINYLPESVSESLKLKKFYVQLKSTNSMDDFYVQLKSTKIIHTICAFMFSLKAQIVWMIFQIWFCLL